MAAIAGKAGFLKYGAVASRKGVYRITGWTANIQSDMLDTTAFSTDGVVWRTVTPGINGWSASFTGHQDIVGDSSGQKAVLNKLLTPGTGSVRLEFDETGLEALYGNVFVENIGFDIPVEGVQGISGTLRGTGSLTYTTAA